MEAFVSGGLPCHFHFHFHFSSIRFFFSFSSIQAGWSLRWMDCVIYGNICFLSLDIPNDSPQNIPFKFLGKVGTRSFVHSEKKGFTYLDDI
jgi:hypothetical protein